MGMVYNAVGITVMPKEGEMFYLDLALDNEDAAELKAPESMSAFEKVTKTSQLLKVLDGCFLIKAEIFDEDEEEMRDVKWTLKDLVEFYDYDKLYPKFKKKVNALKTIDQIRCITVFTNYDYDYDRKYDWVKYDFEKNEVKSGTDRAKALDNSGNNFAPAETEMFQILAEK